MASRRPAASTASSSQSAPTVPMVAAEAMSWPTRAVWLPPATDWVAGASAPLAAQLLRDKPGALYAMAELKAPAPKAKSTPKAATAPTKAPTAPPASNPAAATLPAKVPSMSGEPDVLVPYPTAGLGTQKSASTGLEGDPDVAYAFTLNINNVDYGMFSEIAGISWKAEPIPVRVGGNNEYSLNMRGAGKFEPLTVKRGWFAASGEFFDLLKDGLSGSLPRTNKGRFKMIVRCLNRSYQQVGSYTFFNAFIIEYTGPSFNSMSGQVGFEQLRFAYDYFEYKAR